MAATTKMKDSMNSFVKMNALLSGNYCLNVGIEYDTIYRKDVKAPIATTLRQSYFWAQRDATGLRTESRLY